MNSLAKGYQRTVTGPKKLRHVLESLRRKKSSALEIEKLELTDSGAHSA